MFCIKCGTKLPDDARFCSGCGCAVNSAPKSEPTPEPVTEPEVNVNNIQSEDNAAEQGANVAFTTPDFQPTEPSLDEESPKKKKKKLKLVLAIAIPIAVALLLASAVAWFFVFRDKAEPCLTHAYVDNTGTAYMCYDDGRVVKLGSDIERAIMTPDGKKIVVFEKEGRIYWTNAKTSEKHTVAEANKERPFNLIGLTDRFLAYEQSNSDGGKMYRYEFGEGTSREMLAWNTNSKAQWVASHNFIGDESFSFLIAKDNTISVLKPDEKNYVDIGEYSSDDNIKLMGVSLDGELAAWAKIKNGKYTVILYSNGKEYTVGSGDAVSEEITAENYLVYLERYIDETYDSNQYSSIDDYAAAITDKWANEIQNSGAADGTEFIIDKMKAYFGSNGTMSFNAHIAPDGKTAVFLYGDKTAYVHGDTIEEVKLPTDILSGYQLFTSNGYMLERDMKASRAVGYYTTVLEDEKTEDGLPLVSLYFIRFKDGEKAKLVSKVQNVGVADDKIVYTDKNGNTSIAEMDFKALQLEDSERISSDIIYMGASEASSDYIYYMKLYSDKSVTFDLYVYDIDEEESRRIASEVPSTFDVSVDGEKVYYFADTTTDAEGVSYGTLKVYDANKQKSETISNDVIIGSVNSNIFPTDEIDPDSLWFEKYQGKTDMSYTCNICHYDGKKTRNVVKNMEKKAR